MLLAFSPLRALVGQGVVCQVPRTLSLTPPLHYLKASVSTWQLLLLAAGLHTPFLLCPGSTRMENHSSGDFQEKTNHPHHGLQVTVAGSSWWRAPYPGMPLCVIGMIREVEFGPVAGSAAQRRPQRTGWWREGVLEAVGERESTCLGPGVRPLGNACPRVCFPIRTQGREFDRGISVLL